MKLTTDFNFINILQAAFGMKVIHAAFCTYSLGWYFLAKKNWQKTALKMLVKFTTVSIFTKQYFVLRN